MFKFHTSYYSKTKNRKISSISRVRHSVLFYRFIQLQYYTHYQNILRTDDGHETFIIDDRNILVYIITERFS